MRKLVTILLLLFYGSTLFAAEIGDDGLHKQPWLRDTFKDLREDLDEANQEGKRLLVIIEQRGCIYCAKMHEEVFTVPQIRDYIEQHYFVVQINMFGDIDVTDFDGQTMAEKDIVKRWNAMFTPLLLFFPEEVAVDHNAAQAAVANMPGAFGKHTTKNLLSWIVEKGYETDEGLQKYHARKLSESGLD